MNYKTFETKRLYIRPTEEDDAAFFLQLFNSPKWLKFIGDRGVRTIEEARDYITKKMMPQLERLGYSNYIVIKKDDLEKIGTCGLYDREGLEGIDLGFAFLPEFEQQGFAYEAACKIRDAAFEEFNLESIQAITTKDNFSSQKLLEKLGFKFTELTFIPNDDEELMLYKLHASELANHII